MAHESTVNRAFRSGDASSSSHSSTPSDKGVWWNIPFWSAVFFWTFLTLALGGFHYYQSYYVALAMGRGEALASFNKDVAFRAWAARKGGVYVPISEETPPNPHLANVPERDVVTPSGRVLTLVNPAYLTRQVATLAEELYGMQSHITSLNPIRPGNAPDEWEISALRAFEQGEKEMLSLTTLNDEPYVRFMRPLVVDASCLKCHEQQGYKEGDIRGGISESVSWAPYQASLLAEVRQMALGYGGIWAFGILGLTLGRSLLHRRFAERRQAEDALGESEARLRASQEIARLGSWELDTATNKLVWSDETYRIFGFRPQEFEVTYERFLEAVYPEDRAAVDAAYSISLIEEQSSYEIEHRVLQKNTGEIRYVYEKCNHVRDVSGRVIRSSGVVQDITERRRIEDTQLFLLQCGYSGEGFFESLARYLGEQLSMDFVCIDRLDDGTVTAQTVAVWYEGALQENFVYSLKDTPGAEVVGKVTQCFPSNVKQLFPKDEILQKMEAECYVGTTLWSFDGKPIGLIAVAGRQVLLNSDIVESILKLVAVRAAGELERKHAETALLERTHELERFNEALVGREKRIIELKEEINELCAQLGHETRYLPVWLEPVDEDTQPGSKMPPAGMEP